MIPEWLWFAMIYLGIGVIAKQQAIIPLVECGMTLSHPQSLLLTVLWPALALMKWEP